MNLVSFLLFLVVIEALVVVFLFCQCQENHSQHTNDKIQEQEEIGKIAKLVIQSTTQNHPLIAFQHAFEAKIRLRKILKRNKGVTRTEKELQLPKGDLEKLQHQVEAQLQLLQQFIVEQILKRQPKYKHRLDEMAGLRPRTEKSVSEA